MTFSGANETCGICALGAGISLGWYLNLYGFRTKDLKVNKYENVINLYKKGALTKNLINAIYSS